MKRCDETATDRISHWGAAKRMLAAHHIPDSLRIDINAFPWLGLVVGMQAAIAAVVAIIVTLLSPWPEMTGYTVLGTMIALFGRFSVGRARLKVLVQCALCQLSGVVIMSLAGYALAFEGQLLVLALLCGLFFVATVSCRFGPPGALIFVFAAGASLGPTDIWQTAVDRGLAVCAGAVLSLVLCVASDVLAQKAIKSMPAVPVMHQPSRRSLLIAACRIALTAFVASWATHWAGAAHPAWAALGVVAVMQGIHLHLTIYRAVQRMAGTLAGALIVWGLLHQQPSFWVVVLLLAIAQVAAELVIGLNYALTQIFVTVMALLTTYFLSGGRAGTEIAAERILDTMVGATIALVFALIFSTLDERTHIEQRAKQRQSLLLKSSVP
ncbi:FUSC family protein [Agrobacterium sp.]|uniref:FUSC family protein n=1 Tax=Agrobacterium sp. TaxID=361 RepID=UPI0028AB8B75|nr:FUSC family protein [Agrobacterium sp.]